jgi:hypothetical protein
MMFGTAMGVLVTARAVMTGIHPTYSCFTPVPHLALLLSIIA